jgi:hypothetical protein
MSSDTLVDLGGNEFCDLDTASPQTLQWAAQKLRAKAIAMCDPRFDRFKPAPEPASTVNSFHNLVDRPVEEARPETDFERELKTRRATFQIMKALEEERQQAEQQREQEKADAVAAFRSTLIGQLMR